MALAEHRGTSAGYLCTKAACTAFPRFKCTASHANPVNLPPCCGDIPSYFADIVRRCRLPDTRARPSAQELAQAFPPIRDSLPDMKDLVKLFAHKVTYFCTTCDECGGECRNVHYHCNACFSGNFDLCPTCFGHGSHCFDQEHQLMKIVMRNGRFVSET